MDAERQSVPQPPSPLESGFVEMPRATAAPLVLITGLFLLAGGLVFGVAMVIVGAVLLFIGLGLWVRSLSSSVGHFHEPLVAPHARAQAAPRTSGPVERLATGMPGYRVQLPQKVHPISAGIKGGLVGGLVLPIPALIYGLVSGHGIWYPVNLLAGMALPNIGQMSEAELAKFHLLYLSVGLCIHLATSLVAGLAYGVLLPMLPTIPKPIAWGGLLMPVMWTAVSFVAMASMDSMPVKQLDWPSFIFAQFVFGIVVALIVQKVHRVPPPIAGLIGGLVGGALMVVPAALWAWATDHSVWYPANVLAGMLIPKIGAGTPADLQQFHGDWLGAAMVIHGVMSIVFGIVYGVLLPKLPRIPGPMSWGALLMPVVWTGISYSLMDVVNPALRRHVDWPWFVVSQFIFGIVASIVVVRSEQIVIPPVGPGPSPPTTAGAES
jgi:hypothetical protein